jgi:GxGYxY sequence motif in domain of unknown function N-terminal/GxGYxYP putative glycoside hydrolase C-terminal domain
MSKMTPRSGKLPTRAVTVFAVVVVLFLLGPLTSVVGASHASIPASQVGAPASSQGVAADKSASGTLPNYVPRSSAPGVVDLVSSGGLSEEVSALEGLAARTRPQMLVVNSATDKFWFNYAVKEYGISYTTLSAKDALLDFKSLVTDSSGKVKIILYSSNDPISPTQENMAITLAGVYGALPVQSSDLSSIQSIFGSSNLDTLYNLQGMFKDEVSAYQWLWSQVGSKVTRSFVVSSPSSGVGLTDYIVQHEGFVFSFSLASVMTSSETQEAKTILSNYAQGTPVLGFFGFGPETQTITFLSQLGLFMISCDGVSGLSLYSGLPEAMNLKQVAPAAVTYNPSKTYIAIQYSQGNSIGHLVNENYNLWIQNDSNGKSIRSEVPESWQINPVSAELDPPVMLYYYNTMTPDDYFLSSSSGGAGYVHPDQLPNLGSYLSIANQFNNNANLNEYVIVTGNTQKEQPSLYQTIADDTTVQAIFTKMPHNVQPTETSGVPIFSMTFKVQQSSWTTKDITNAVASLTSLSSKNKFIWIFMANSNPGQQYLVALLKALGPNFVALRSDQFTSVYQQYLAQS